MESPKELHAPVILIWDNLNTRISAAMGRFVSSHSDWLTEVRLPAYAPELNPAEGALHRLLHLPHRPRRQAGREAGRGSRRAPG